LPENDPQRMAEIDVISKCYNYTIFGSKNGNYYVISGSDADWPSSVYLQANMTSIDCGEYIHHQDLSSAFKSYKSSYGNTSHMTMMFNIFVFYTLFNQINSRVINDEFNIFYNISKNLFFILISIVKWVFKQC